MERGRGRPRGPLGSLRSPIFFALFPTKEPGLRLYYRRNVAVSLINHIKAELDGQFSGNEFPLKEKKYFPLTAPFFLLALHQFVNFFFSFEVFSCFNNSKQICLCWRQASLVSYRQCFVIRPVICQTSMGSSTLTRMNFRRRSFYV